MVAGFTDRPRVTLSEDTFGIKPYIEGLTAFISDCKTPMTIAVQGDCGTGKTSVMNMISSELGENCVYTWFNTWQYSQFNMGDNLAISLINQLISVFHLEDKEAGKGFKKTLSTISKVVSKATKGAVLTVVDMAAGSHAANGLEKVIDGASAAVTGKEYFDISISISLLKNQFQKCIDMVLEDYNKDKVVIFVDDIDRLNPEKAIDLLEVLKLFLDCKGCVFVLAIDYQIVSQGILEKYGYTLCEEKGKTFFDKIIQLTFKMPISLYNTDTFIESLLTQLGINRTTTDDKTLLTYKQIIKLTIGCNPRLTKRLFNAILLVKKIYETDEPLTPHAFILLFAVLCLQLSDEKIYHHLVRNKNDLIGGELIAGLSKQENYGENVSYICNEEENELRKEFNIDEPYDTYRICTLMKLLGELTDTDSSGEININEAQLLIKLLKLTTVTSPAGENAKDNETIWDCRRFNRLVLKKTITKLSQRYNKYSFKIYQSFENRKNWRMHYAGCSTEFTLCGKKIEFGAIIKTDIVSGKIPVVFYIWKKHETAECFDSLFLDWGLKKGKDLGFIKKCPQIYETELLCPESEDTHKISDFIFVHFSKFFDELQNYKKEKEEESSCKN